MPNIGFTNDLSLASKLFLVVIIGCLLLPVAHAELTTSKNNVPHSSVGNAGAKKQRKFLVGFAQNTMNNDWRKQQVKDVEKKFAHHTNIRFIATDARGQTAKQILDIENLFKQGMDRVDSDEYAALLNRRNSHSAPIIQPRVELTEEEMTWLKQHAPFRVGVDPDTAPYKYVDEYGQHQGITADYMQLLSERLGVDLNVVPDLSWQQVMDQAREKKIDLLAAVTRTPERSRFLQFSRPGLQNDKAVQAALIQKSAGLYGEVDENNSRADG